MSDWRWNLYAVIPLASKTIAGGVANIIMPDVDEDKIFDSIRMSVTGNEPATHFCTSCPVTQQQAVEWLALFLPGESIPVGWGTPQLTWDASILGSFNSARNNPNFIAVVTRRLGDDHMTLTKINRDVVVIDTAEYPDVTQIPNIDDIFSRVGLKQVIFEL